MTIPLDKTKKRLLTNPKVREEYERLAPQFDLAQSLIKARTRIKISQEEVARRMGTTQSTVARMESGRWWPSTRSLERYAAALGAHIRLTLVMGK